jgi:hypothetical protein
MQHGNRRWSTWAHRKRLPRSMMRARSAPRSPKPRSLCRIPFGLPRRRLKNQQRSCHLPSMSRSQRLQPRWPMLRPRQPSLIRSSLLPNRRRWSPRLLRNSNLLATHHRSRQRPRATSRRQSSRRRPLSSHSGSPPSLPPSHRPRPRSRFRTPRPSRSRFRTLRPSRCRFRTLRPSRCRRRTLRPSNRLPLS